MKTFEKKKSLGGFLIFLKTALTIFFNSLKKINELKLCEVKLGNFDFYLCMSLLF